MNKVVLEHYPAERLPDDIRRELGGAISVTVTVEEERPQGVSAAELVAMLKREKAKPGFKSVSIEEATARIRALRDEWDDE
ncbi:MAG: hypothetical protein HY834_15590 [Devosia nanyangense]|uniref:Uncharacterized protein n=1 Tax=Devosia nanyangense TaxID=1228055 RepID=A0A933NZA6_9HYPH|nr:hypothetical protein [Devosia nanyangense]